MLFEIGINQNTFGINRSMYVYIDIKDDFSALDPNYKRSCPGFIFSTTLEEQGTITDSFDH